MNLYLPIAEMSVNVLVLFSMGAGVGFLSGMFGVGGGFLM
ncbi:MAG: sulfite exporter TauE/SafE family protein, partial [Pseudomonadota bacterium]